MPWVLDPNHTHVSFSAKHMMVATVRGSFTDVEAEVRLDEVAPERSSVAVTIRAASLETGAADRDAHLRSPDFLDVERYPVLTFRSTRVAREGDAFHLDGDLTIRDVTRPVTLTGEFTGPVTGPWGGRHVGFTLDGELDREAFGLTWNMALEAGGMLVGRKVKLQIEAEVMEPAQVAA